MWRDFKKLKNFIITLNYYFHVNKYLKNVFEIIISGPKTKKNTKGVLFSKLVFLYLKCHENILVFMSVVIM